jgi:BA14K-like protein
MFLKKHKFLTLGFMIGLGLQAMPQAQAMPTGLPKLDSPVNVDLVQVRDQGQRRAARWDRRLHGDRCRYRAGDCRYYRSGYYYRTPWWTLPLVGAGVVIGSTIDNDGPIYGRRGNRHIAWCEDRYRSYNPRTNTWISNSGAERECNSPYN